MSFRSKTAKYLASPAFIISTLIITGVIMTFYGGVGYLLGLLIVLITLWAIRWDLGWFGISRPDWVKTFVNSLLYTVVIIIVVDVILTPAVELLTEPLDYSGFDWIRGNIIGLILFTLFIWIMAAFGEELFYRGYGMNRLAFILGNTNIAWFVAALISSVMFGIVHWYQGLSGVLSTGFVGLFFAFLFMEYRKNLVLCMLIHGIYDMWGLTLIYLDRDRVITEWMQSNVYQFLN